jgi:hypothetical protein
MSRLANPDTPFAVVDLARLDRNIARLETRLRRLGVPLRLHVRTANSADVAAQVHRDGPGPITVSTLAEAKYVAPSKQPRPDGQFAIDRSCFEPRFAPSCLRLSACRHAATISLADFSRKWL